MGLRLAGFEYFGVLGFKVGMYGIPGCGAFVVFCQFLGCRQALGVEGSQAHCGVHKVRRWMML